MIANSGKNSKSFVDGNSCAEHMVFFRPWNIYGDCEDLSARVSKAFELLPNGITKETRYDRRTWYIAETASVSSIYDADRVICARQDEGRTIMLRGGLALPEGTLTNRRKADYKDGRGKGIVDVPRRWLLIDIDKIPKGYAPDPSQSPQAALQSILALLPPAIRSKTLHYHWSSSAGVAGKVKIHFVIWLDRALAEREASQLLTAIDKWMATRLREQGFETEKGVSDLRVGFSQQPLFIVPPHFLNGAVDPIPGDLRRGMIEGDGDTVCIDDLVDEVGVTLKLITKTKKTGAEAKARLWTKPDSAPRVRKHQPLAEPVDIRPVNAVRRLLRLETVMMQNAVTDVHFVAACVEVGAARKVVDIVKIVTFYRSHREGWQNGVPEGQRDEIMTLVTAEVFKSLPPEGLRDPAALRAAAYEVGLCIVEQAWLDTEWLSGFDRSLISRAETAGNGEVHEYTHSRDGNLRAYATDDARCDYAGDTIAEALELDRHMSAEEQMQAGLQTVRSARTRQKVRRLNRGQKDIRDYLSSFVSADARVAEMLKAGKTVREIATAVGKSVSATQRAINRVRRNQKTGKDSCTGFDTPKERQGSVPGSTHQESQNSDGTDRRSCTGFDISDSEVRVGLPKREGDGLVPGSTYQETQDSDGSETASCTGSDIPEGEFDDRSVPGSTYHDPTTESVPTGGMNFGFVPGSTYTYSKVSKLRDRLGNQDPGLESSRAHACARVNQGQEDSLGKGETDLTKEPLTETDNGPQRPPVFRLPILGQKGSNPLKVSRANGNTSQSPNPALRIPGEYGATQSCIGEPLASVQASGEAAGHIRRAVHVSQDNAENGNAADGTAKSTEVTQSSISESFVCVEALSEATDGIEGVYHPDAEHKPERDPVCDIESVSLPDNPGADGLVISDLPVRDEIRLTETCSAEEMTDDTREGFKRVVEHPAGLKAKDTLEDTIVFLAALRKRELEQRFPEIGDLESYDEFVVWRSEHYEEYSYWDRRNMLSDRWLDEHLRF